MGSRRRPIYSYEAFRRRVGGDFGVVEEDCEVRNLLNKFINFTGDALLSKHRDVLQ
jgi:hypothetical protein